MPCGGRPPTVTIAAGMTQPPDDFTRLIERAGSGDAEAAAELLPRVYDQLRALAALERRELDPWLPGGY